MDSFWIGDVGALMLEYRYWRVFDQPVVYVRSHFPVAHFPMADYWGGDGFPERRIRTDLTGR